jgi:hypothetical protein
MLSVGFSWESVICLIYGGPSFPRPEHNEQDFTFLPRTRATNPLLRNESVFDRWLVRSNVIVDVSKQSMSI